MFNRIARISIILDTSNTWFQMFQYRNISSIDRLKLTTHKSK